MYIITENGDKLPVDTSSVDYEKGWHPWFQSVTAIDDDSAHLTDVWIVELQRSNERRSFPFFEMEWFKDVYFDHQPTKEEIMHAIFQSGGDVRTIAFVRHGYKVEIDYE